MARPPLRRPGGEPVLTAEVIRLQELRLAAVEHRIEADLAVGQPQQGHR